MLKFDRKSANRLVTAYNLMIQSMLEAYEDRHGVVSSLQQVLDKARQEVVSGGILTAEEASQLTEHIKVDVNDAAELMMESSAEFYDWLTLDIEVIERKVMEMYLQVAGNTRGIIDQLVSRPALVEDIPVYTVGRIAGPAKLVCAHCGRGKPYLSQLTVTPCDNCGHSRFIERGHR